MSRRIFITVAEVSGDNHAAQLIRELKALDPTFIIEGVGGPEMEAAGALIHRNTVIKAAMGLQGLLRAGEVYRLLRWTRRHFETHRPDLWIGVDSPSMNFHFAKIAKERGIPTLQYVAPQLWAWAIWRMKKVRRWVDCVACILPFEEAFFAEHGVKAIFVGHPIFDQLPARERAAINVAESGASLTLVPGVNHAGAPIDDGYRGKSAGERISNRMPVIGLLAGSRKSEAEQNFPHMASSAIRILREFPGATFLAPTTPNTHSIVSRCVEQLSTSGAPPLKIEIGLGQFDEMVPRCDLCITVSGTATVHVAAYNVPMLVVYHGSRLTWNLLGRWVIATRTFALVNVLATRSAPGTFATTGHIVPEFVPWYGGPEVSALAIDMLKHPERLESQRQDLAKLVSTFDKPGASKNAALLAMEMMGHTRKSEFRNQKSESNPNDE